MTNWELLIATAAIVYLLPILLGILGAVVMLVMYVIDALRGKNVR